MTDLVVSSAAERRRETMHRRAQAVGENVAAFKALEAEAFEASDHLEFGYASHGEYMRDEFADEFRALDRGPRGELVIAMHEHGMSSRQIAPILGVGNATVFRDIRDAVSDETPIDTSINNPEPSPDAPAAFANVDPSTGEVIEAELIDDETHDPYPLIQVRRVAPKSPGSELTLINDIRLYLRTLASSAQVAQMSPAGRRHLVDALNDAIKQIEKE